MGSSTSPHLRRLRISRALLQRRTRLGWLHAPANLRGSIYLLSALAVFGAMTTSIKLIGQSLPLSEVLILRQLIMMALLLPLFRQDPWGAVRTSHPILQLIRGICSLGAMYFGLTAVQHIPLADATALGFSQVLFVTVLAVVVLHEKVSWQSWFATAAGFIGVIVMLRPGESGFDPYGLYSILGALFGAGVTISVRLLTTSERTETILFYQGLVLIAALIIPAFQNWVAPSPQQWALIGVIGVAGTLGQFLMTRAYQIGEASSLAPLDFARLLLNSAAGYLIFSEIPGAATVVGAALVITATIFMIRKNGAKPSPH